jgi:hypothetical protein
MFGQMHTRSIVATACAVMVLAGCGAGGGASGPSGPQPPASVSPSPQVTSEFPTFSGSEALAMSDPVRFRGAGGVRLEGRVFGSGDVGVVLGHMRPGDQSQWFGFAAFSPTRGTPS